uniref:G-protein coupled receptors family 1 profile domain-containing protein n=1 Tax=Acrobeloides nanus TaxID=290746 RepID=A0A914E1L1_9BILA
MATVERLLRTFKSEKLTSIRRFLEQHRPLVCFSCILLALSYKLCTYFEIHYIEHANCTNWTKYEILPTKLAENYFYNFYWMFVTRNLVDRIIPFFVLVLMNFLIIRTLKREYKRYSIVDQRLICASDQNNKKNLREATRVLIAVVSLYLISQSLQVVITFWEAFNKQALNEEYAELYSYLNDAMSIMTLVAR